jgi:HEAT repeat protein
MADDNRDREREARIDADLAFLEELEAMEAAEAAGLDAERSLDDLDTELSAPTEEPRGDIAARLRDPNLRFGSLRFLSGLTRAEANALRETWPTLPVERRRRLVRAMEDLAELSVDLDFARALRVAMRDTDATVRGEAIDALWENESPDLLAALLDVVERDESAPVRRAAARALAPFAERAAGHEVAEPLAGQLRDRLLAVARNEREEMDVRRSAIESLGVYDDQPVNALIGELYDRGGVDDRTSALHAMGRTVNARWLSTVRDETEAEEREVRFEATRALGLIGRSEGVPDLIGRLEDEDRAVRLAAVAALGQIGSRAATNALREHRADADDEEWTDAVDTALAEAGLGDQPLLPL